LVNNLRLKVKGWFKKLLPWLFILIATFSYGKDVTLSWDPSPSPGVTEYTLYWDNQPNPPFVNSVRVGIVLNHFIANLEDSEQHWFAVTALDADNNESVYSNIVNSPIVEITPEPLPELNIKIQWNIIH
jgi:hypothetical protein